MENDEARLSIALALEGDVEWGDVTGVRNR
jgi:hypothetical protein